MISHAFRCIFIHIPRTGGTSIEQWFTGSDWWRTEASTKHLLASQAKRLYAEWWDSYFKFAFVRHPSTRMLSCFRFPDHFGLGLSAGGDLLMHEYHYRFGTDIILEYDYRFYRRSDLVTENHRPGQIYLNILDEPLDFIGRFENFTEDLREVGRLTGHNSPFRHWANQFDPPLKHNDFRIRNQELLNSIFLNDLQRFGYD